MWVEWRVCVGGRRSGLATSRVHRRGFKEDEVVFGWRLLRSEHSGKGRRYFNSIMLKDDFALDLLCARRVFPGHHGHHDGGGECSVLTEDDGWR
jgi:hypothetical protein